MKKSEWPLAKDTRIAVARNPKSDLEAPQRAIAGLLADREYLEAFSSAVSVRLERAEAALAAARAEIGVLSQQAAGLETTRRFLSGQLAEALHANSSLLGSWSWKITSPLRLAVDLLRVAGNIPGFLRNNPAPFLALARVTQWLRFRRLVSESGVFDEGYYLTRYPEVAATGMNPLFHFFVFGAGERRRPHLLFDTGYYIDQNPGVAATGVNPLVHYLRQGAYEGRNPNPDFDSAYYLEQNPDVRAMGLNPLAHYLGAGTAEGCNPNRGFDTAAYLDENPELAISAVNPLAHFLAKKEDSR